ncbi:hypothetical protein [Roseicella sp. DB1501]|uniref:hypothetical protein n=1 Tax=Roseicella sp. DB1501 TaxID=2730925 RepID=UPI001490BB47|nr:hypothetical protein [Roseicella sp. DB1501]NOG70444.1 hypothetical protein [Roseicella sp. DB1501]
MTRAEQIKSQMDNMLLSHDALFTVPALAAEYDALSAELRALNRGEAYKPYDMKRAGLEANVTFAANKVRDELHKLRWLLKVGGTAENLAYGREGVALFWDQYRAARRELVAA